jgi:hypothetical protein
MKRLQSALIVPVMLIGIAMPSPASARIKLITLPVRERVEIQLDHPDVTLVEEERMVPLVAGANQVDFSWANTQIDPNTVIFRVLGPAEGNGVEAKLISVSYPPGEQALVWQVSSSASGSARVRISYVLDGLDKSFYYRAVAGHDEQTLELAQYLRLQNLANEEYGQSGLGVGFGDGVQKPIGLNETKQILINKFARVPADKTYSCSPTEFGYLDQADHKLRVPMHYVLHNDSGHGLGKASLPYGKVRIFQDDGRGAVAFLGEDWGRFTPVDDRMRLYLGVAQDIVVRRTIDRNEQKRVAGNLHNREVVIKYEIENFKNQPVTLDVIENLDALRNEVGMGGGRDVQWELGKQTTFEGGPDRDESSYNRTVFHATLPAARPDGKTDKVVHALHLILHNEW